VPKTTSVWRSHPKRRILLRLNELNYTDIF